MVYESVERNRRKLIFKNLVLLVDASGMRVKSFTEINLQLTSIKISEIKLMITINSTAKGRTCLMEMFVCVGLVFSVNESIMYIN